MIFTIFGRVTALEAFSARLLCAMGLKHFESYPLQTARSQLSYGLIARGTVTFNTRSGQPIGPPNRYRNARKEFLTTANNAGRSATRSLANLEVDRQEGYMVLLAFSPEMSRPARQLIQQRVGELVCSELMVGFQKPLGSVYAKPLLRWVPGF